MAVESPSRAPSLSEVEREIVEIFVELGRLLSLPRSVGEIYGLLFASGDMLTLDDLTARLGISKGSASQGLRFLRTVGAARVVYRPGDRKDYFQAEADVARLLRGFLREQFQPGLEGVASRLQRLHEMLEVEGGGVPPEVVSRVQRLRSWQDKGRRLLPLVAAFLKL